MRRRDKIDAVLLSAEIRLFWFDAKPAALEHWFLEGPAHLWAPVFEERTDVYLADEDQDELGLKTRGEKPGIEVKGLIAVPGRTVEFNSREILIELWSKWSSKRLSFDPAKGVELDKRRWTRKFDTGGAQPIEIPEGLPKLGCNVEWTIVQRSSGETCWTLGFEAYGNLDDVEKSLQDVVRTMKDRNPPRAPGARAISYPAWIRTLSHAVNA